MARFCSSYTTLRILSRGHDGASPGGGPDLHCGAVPPPPYTAPTPPPIRVFSFFFRKCRLIRSRVWNAPERGWSSSKQLVYPDGMLHGYAQRGHGVVGPGSGTPDPWLCEQQLTPPPSLSLRHPHDLQVRSVDHASGKPGQYFNFDLQVSSARAERGARWWLRPLVRPVSDPRSA